MIKAILLCLMSCVCCLMAQAQDIVRLKDGSLVSGRVVEYIVGDHLRIELPDGSVQEIPDANVVRVMEDKRKHPFEIKTKGYFNHTSFNLLIGNSFASSVGASFYMVNGWQWNERWAAGLGIGMETMVFQQLMPFFADVRYNLSTRRRCPYIQASAGYAISLGDSYGEWGDWWNKPYGKNHGGIGAGIQIGYRNYWSPHMGYTLSLGFRYQTNKAEYPNVMFNGLPFMSAHTEHMRFAKVVMGFGLLIR